MAKAKLLTVSLPPNLFQRARQLARQENRSQSELVREALRQYIETTDWRSKQRKEAMKELLAIIHSVQKRTREFSPEEIERDIEEAITKTRKKYD